MAVRYGNVHKLVWRVISKELTVEIVTAHCNICEKHSMIAIHQDQSQEESDRHARCMRCLSVLDGVPNADPTKVEKLGVFRKTLKRWFK